MTARVLDLAEVRRRVESHQQSAASRAIAASLAHRRGGPAPYFADRDNSCPSCGGRAWHVGRAVAECAACELPLPIVQTSQRGD